MLIAANRPVTMASDVIWRPAPAAPAAAFSARGSPVETRRMEAEVCRRFVQISCAKMHASRQARGGARLHKNLLILRLLAKARSNVAILPYECASLLRRKQYLNSSRLPHPTEDELPSQKHFHQFFTHEKADLNQTDNDIAIDNETGTETENSAASFYCKNGSNAMECQPSETDNESENENDEDNFSMEINYINERVNEEQQSRLDNSNDDKADEIRNENENCRADEKATEMEYCSSADSDPTVIFTPANCWSNQPPAVPSTGLRLYERVAIADARAERPANGNSYYYESDERLQFEERLDEHEPTVAKPWSQPADGAQFVFELAEATIPSLQTVISNPVSPPLAGAMDGGLLTSFAATIATGRLDADLNQFESVAATTVSSNRFGSLTAATASSDRFNNLNFSKSDTLIVADRSEAICECEPAAGRPAERRKRKTAAGEPIGEKRYCNATNRATVSEDYCGKCGGQILGCVSTLEERETATVAMLVPDIDTPDGYRNRPDDWPSPELRYQFNYSQQQDKQQQQYFYSSATICGHNNSCHTVADNNNNNDIFEQNNKSYFSPPTVDTGISGWDQVVPVGAAAGRPHSHFVGPLVGLVAETPFILMF